MPATTAKVVIPARHSPRRDRRRCESTPPLMRYAISTDCACFTGNLAAGCLCATRFYGRPERCGRREFGRKIDARVARSQRSKRSKPDGGDLHSCARPAIFWLSWNARPTTIRNLMDAVLIDAKCKTSFAPFTRALSGPRNPYGDAVVTVPRRDFIPFRVGIGRWGSGGVRRRVRGPGESFRQVSCDFNMLQKLFRWHAPC